VTGADPVCISAGAFVLGTTHLSNATPVTTVTLSEFFIDRQPVTADRYRECVLDGGCADWPVPVEASMLSDDAVAVGLSHGAAAAFCVWDGGSLPTEYQWEKAARGAVPDTRTHPLGLAAAVDATCGVNSFCEGMGVNLLSKYGSLLNIRLSGLSGATASPWGVEFTGTGFGEWTGTLYQANHNSIATTDPGNPPFPVSPTAFTVRAASSGPVLSAPIGMPSMIFDGLDAFSDVACSRRQNNSRATTQQWMIGFRCVY